MGESSTSIAKVKALLGGLSRLLYFAKEGDIVFTKPKQLLSEETFQALRQRIQEIGGRYVDLNTGFEIPKVAPTGFPEMTGPPEKPVEKVILKEPASQVGFESTILKKNVARPRKVSEVLTTNISLDDLELGSFSPRKVFSQQYIDELAESIEREGQLKPVIVRPHPEEENRYQIIDGEHRVRALRKLGRYLVRAEVRRLNDEEAFFLAMRVNQMHGKRLEDLEEGLHIKRMMEEFGYTQIQIAEKFKKSQPWVSNRLSLANRLAPKTEEAFITCVITKSHAREIAELPKEDQPAVVERVVKEKLSFKDTETLVHSIKNKPNSQAEILAKPINELTHPPKDIQEFEAEHGPEQPKFEPGQCPHCGAEYVVNWPLCRINWREKTRE